MDDSFDVFKNIKAEVSGNLDNIESEEDAKLQIINRVIVEVLGWHQSDVGTERKHETGFSDYLIGSSGNPEWVLEAKRIGRIQINTQEKEKLRHLKLSGPALKDAEKHLSQAAGYAQSEGISLAVLSDGISWIVFKSFSSGKKFKELTSFVFPSLNAIESNFSDFFELLSKESVEKKLYRSLFDNLHENRLNLSRSLQPAFLPSEIRLANKQQLAIDLYDVFQTFFTRLIGSDDAEMLVECFVETKESRLADFSLEKITAQVLSGIERTEKGVESELTELIETAVGVDKGQTVLIVGPTGAGKSTFLERFFKKTLSNALRQQCLVARINCLDSSGNTETFQTWMTEALIKILEEQMFEDGVATYEELQGLYQGEYLKYARGAWKPLYSKDKSEFKEKFGELLQVKVDEDREGFLHRLLKDLIKNRKKLPVILIDNTDEFPLEYKERLFQFTHALRRSAEHALLIFPITDKSAWAFSKTDIFGIYTPKSYFLPTPSPREVFRKRIEYINKKILSTEVVGAKGDYFTKKGIRITIDNIGHFAKVLENVFVEKDYTSRTIGRLANYNIRRTLELSQRIITSPVFGIGELISSYVTGNSISSSFYYFMNALMKGDYELYRDDKVGLIQPIFSVDKSHVQSPLMKIRVLRLLDSTRVRATTIEEKHLSVDSIVSYFEACDCSDSATENALLWLLETQLIEPFDATVRDLSAGQQVALSPSGSIHLQMACSNHVFFEQMALTTHIVDSDVTDRIKDCYNKGSASFASLAQVRKLFVDYLISEDLANISIPAAEQYQGQATLHAELKSKFIEDGSVSDAVVENFDAQHSSTGQVETEVIAVVDYYDATKKYGFVDVDNFERRIFFHASTLADNNLADSVADGDVLLCDVSRGEKGLFVSKIHELEADTAAVEVHEFVVLKALADRNYGFARIVGRDDEAFFHFSLFGSAERSKLVEGFKFRAEIKLTRTQAQNSFQVRRVV